MSLKIRSMRKSIIVGLSILLLVLTTACGQSVQQQENASDEVNDNSIYVAAVGDSITDEYSSDAAYPEKLSQMLGGEYIVRNFGRSNYAVQSTADFPYMRTKTYKESLAFDPHLVLIMLGTNDTKNRNWEGPEAFKAEYEALLNSYLELDSMSRVILISPPTVFVDSSSRRSIDRENIAPIREVIAEVANEYELEFIDMTEATANNPEWFFDGVHPTPEGAEKLAEIIFNEI